jgi:phosphoglycolate phosphatase-like HAD superfamily hydrolase
MLILFDIDGTLITSRSEANDGGSRDGVGMASMIEAGRTLYGPNFTLDGIEIAGRLDCLIWREAAQRNGVANAEAEHARFRAEYARVLQTKLSNRAPVRLLPGARELVQALAHVEAVTLGLLTGNYPETGRMKLEAAGLEVSIFTVGAWGSDGRSRRDLPPVAMQAHRERLRSEIEPKQVIIIGDTPHDVDCASAHGCRSIGVATGVFTVEALQASGADLAVKDLSDTAAIMGWMLQADESVLQ